MAAGLSLAGKITIGAAIILAAFLFARIVRKALNRTMSGFEWADQIGSLIVTTAYYAILGGGVMTGISTMGIDITPIIAALGLGGFVLGFALRDAISNLLAGVLIIIYRPFIKGDNISVAGAEGVVDEINLRYTVLIGESGKTLIPNQMIVSTTVKVANSD